MRRLLFYLVWVNVFSSRQSHRWRKVAATGLHDWSQFLLAGERRAIAGRHFDSRSTYRERETLVMEGLVTERTISYQYCKTSPSPILVTDTRHTCHTRSLSSHSSYLCDERDECDELRWRVSVTSVTSVGDTRHRHSSPTLSPTPTPTSLVKLKNNVY